MGVIQNRHTYIYMCKNIYIYSYIYVYLKICALQICGAALDKAGASRRVFKTALVGELDALVPLLEVSICVHLYVSIYTCMRVYTCKYMRVYM